MSDHAARAALERMNLREVAVAAHYTGIAADLRQMSTTDPVAAHAAFLARRADLCAAYGLAPVEQRKPFAFAGGLAIIPISGTLINRFGQSYGYVTGYNFIRSQMNAAEADDDVTGIIFDMNSYGGEAAGCFELAAEIAALSKPNLGVIDSNCYSACMALASGMKRVVATPSGGAGSIGVVAMHVDFSELLADAGIKVTFIHAGDHKVDGNPYEALSPAVKKDIQKGIDKSYSTFVALVAKHRKMDEKAVRDTEARIYRADEALALGLIDAIETPNVAVQAFFGELSGSTLQLQQEPTNMATNDQTKPGADQADALATAQATASAEARTAERARISGIQSCEEAKGRESLANHLALNTEMSVDAAKGVLAASPKAAAAAPAAANPLAAAMAATGGGPKIGADAAAADKGGESDADATNFLISSFSAASGRKLKLVGAE